MAAKNIDREKLRNSVENEVQMFLGETIIARAVVRRCNTLSTRDFSVIGNLFVTNFKVAFICSSDSKMDNKIAVKNYGSAVSIDEILVEEQCYSNDLVPLTAIHQIYAISTPKQKRKKVKSARKEVKDHYDIIEIETKDFRIIKYDLKKSSLNDRRSCFRMISHYAFPTSVERLFAFDYGKHMLQSNSESVGRVFCMFSHSKDYKEDLSRLKASEQWRVSNINHDFIICESLPEYNVCPSTLEDENLKTIATNYVEKRFPIWLWNDPCTGAALLVSARLRDVSFHPQQLLNCIGSCHRSNDVSNEVQSFDLCLQCPTLKELKHDFDNLRKASIVHSIKEFWSTDSTWLSDIDNCRWLHRIFQVLVLAESVACIIKDDIRSVIINDDSGRDFSLVISSIVQILLDPYYRTLVGLQALIQKDWVMGGHPFSRRSGNIHTPKSEGKSDVYDGKSPVFLLFLDCLHQLINRHPTKFEYTEQFLILIADCSYSSLFKTFIFNCKKESKSLSGITNLVSAWDFISLNILVSKFISILRNPAYDMDIGEKIGGMLATSKYNPVGLAAVDFISPFSTILNIQLWRNYFCRWFPSMNKQKGFSANIILQLQQKQLMEEVVYLEDRMEQLQHMINMNNERQLTLKLHDVSRISNQSALNRKKQHKREASRNFDKEEDQERFLNLISDFCFLKLL